jgi:hypothetical protein
MLIASKCMRRLRFLREEAMTMSRSDKSDNNRPHWPLAQKKRRSLWCGERVNHRREPIPHRRRFRFPSFAEGVRVG